MNKKTKAALRATAAGAAFAVSMGDVIDAFAKQTNHPAWYSHYPMKSLVSLNFGEREDLHFRETVLGGTTNPAGTMAHDAIFRKPTDARIMLQLTDGRTLHGANVIEEAAGLVLQQMRSIATTTAPYTKDQVRNYIRNARSIVAAYSIARRVSGCAGIADAYDAQASTKYICMGIPNNAAGGAARSDPNPIINNLAAFRAKLGALTPRIRSLIPANMDLMERTKWLFSNIFVDSPSAKFSAKEFTAEIFWMYRDDGSAKCYTFGASPTILSGDGSRSSPFGAAPASSYELESSRWDSPIDVLTMIEHMIEDMLNQSSTSRIAGDLLKAFGQNAFMDFPDFDPYARTPFVYDEDVLNQIQNLTCAGMSYSPTGEVLPDYQTLVDATAAEAKRARAPSDLPTHVVTTYRDAVTPERLLSMTRLQPFSQRAEKFTNTPNPGTLDVLSELVTFGTEVPQSYQYMEAYARFGASLPLEYSWATIIGNIFNNPTGASIASWAADDWAPAAYVYDSTHDYVVLDAQNWALMNEKDASSYHELATLSLCLIHELVRKTDTFMFVQ